MTRRRQSNVAYVALDRPDDSHSAPRPEDVTAQTVLYGVLRHPGIELSAHQAIEVEQERWSSFAQVAAEYLTIVAEAQCERWTAELRAAGLTATLLPKVVARRSLADADDIGAVLISRLRHTTSRVKRGTDARPRLIAGLVPVADGPMAEDMRRALVERQQLLEARASALAQAAAAQHPSWLRRLGGPPTDPHCERSGRRRSRSLRPPATGTTSTVIRRSAQLS